MDRAVAIQVMLYVLISTAVVMIPLCIWCYTQSRDER